MEILDASEKFSPSSFKRMIVKNH